MIAYALYHTKIAVNLSRFIGSTQHTKHIGDEKKQECQNDQTPNYLPDFTNFSIRSDWQGCWFTHNITSEVTQLFNH